MVLTAGKARCSGSSSGFQSFTSPALFSKIPENIKVLNDIVSLCSLDEVSFAAWKDLKQYVWPWHLCRKKLPQKILNSSIYLFSLNASIDLSIYLATGLSSGMVSCLLPSLPFSDG